MKLPRNPFSSRKQNQPQSPGGLPSPQENQKLFLSPLAQARETNRQADAEMRRVIDEIVRRAGIAADYERPYEKISKPEPIVGFRVWRLGHYSDMLEGMRGVPWESQEMHAICREGREHKAPSSNCMCGIYMRYRAKACQLAPGQVLGACLTWGLVRPHTHGFRVEHARMIALSYNKQTPMAVMDLAKHYQVPLVEQDKLEAYAMEIGHVMTEMPEEPPPPPSWASANYGAPVPLRRPQKRVVWLNPGQVFTDKRGNRIRNNSNMIMPYEYEP